MRDLLQIKKLQVVIGVSFTDKETFQSWGKIIYLIVVQIEKGIIDLKYLIKKVHKYRYATRKEYKKSLTYKYYVDKNLKDLEIKKCLKTQIIVSIIILIQA